MTSSMAIVWPAADILKLSCAFGGLNWTMPEPVPSIFWPATSPAVWRVIRAELSACVADTARASGVTASRSVSAEPQPETAAATARAREAIAIRMRAR